MQVKPPPWELTGEALVAIRLVPQAIARSLVPAEVPIFCSACRRTIALLYVAHYRNSPVGDYRELIVAPAIVRHARGLAFWISHIVVDSRASAMAGRSIWALPKLLGSFEWRVEPHLRAQADSDHVRIRCDAQPRQWGLRVPFMGAARSRLDLLSKVFTVRGSATIHPVRARLDVTGGEALQALGFERSKTMFWLRNMHVAIGRPQSLEAGAAAAGYEA